MWLRASAQLAGLVHAADDMLRGRVSRFSLDALVNIATCKVHLELEAA
jgi:hypothetical protein